MAESKVVEQPISVAGRLKQWIVPALIFIMALAIVVVITGNWNAWASEKTAQETDDANTRADLTPLSTKVAGLVATVAVSDYQSVKTGDLLVQLRDDDFRAQVHQAQAGVASGEAALINNQRQKELQDAHIVQAGKISTPRRPRLKLRMPALKPRTPRSQMHVAPLKGPRRTWNGLSSNAGARRP